MSCGLQYLKSLQQGWKSKVGSASGKADGSHGVQLLSCSC